MPGRYGLIGFVVVLLVMCWPGFASAQPLANLRQAFGANRDLVQANAADALQARRNNVARLQSSGPSRSCAGGSCRQQSFDNRRQVLLIQSRPAPTTLLLIR